MILYYFQLKGINNITDISEIDKKLYLNFNETTGDIENKQESEIKSSGYVLHTLEASFWCFLTTKNYLPEIQTKIRNIFKIF